MDSFSLPLLDWHTHRLETRNNLFNSRLTNINKLDYLIRYQAIHIFDRDRTSKRDKAGGRENISHNLLTSIWLADID